MRGSTRIKLLLIFLSLSCASLAQPELGFLPIPTAFGIGNPNAVQAIDVPYAEDDVTRQIFHLFLPDTLSQSPLIVFFHGGGFRGGSPNQVFTSSRNISDIQYCMANGIAYASVGYRLIQNNDDQGVIKSLTDSRRAIQVFRTYADDLHIDPDRIVVKGNSAGASTSLYLAVMDDFADPQASDPVLRSSTRVCAAALNASQATLDLVRWETDVFRDYDGNGTTYPLDSMANITGFDTFSEFYGGIDSIDDLWQDSLVVDYRRSIDALSNLSSDDPPLYLTSLSSAIHPRDDLTHHSLHAETLITAAAVAGLSEVKALVPARLINTIDGESEIEFLHSHLLTCDIATDVEELNDRSELKLFPNPASDRIRIELDNQAIVEVEVYTLSGKLVLHHRSENDDITDLAIDDLAEGIYVLRSKTEAGLVLSKRFTIGR